MKSRYWTCSRFADWLRGTPKLECGTHEEWDAWKKAAQTAHPVRWWIVEEGLDSVQNFVCWPREKFSDAIYYINNRWITRTHSLTAHPRDIKPGEWRDVGDRFLPCLFNELVDFVEIEQAWRHVFWDEEASKRFSVPWYRRGWLRLRVWRCPEAGLAYLNWASSLVQDEDWGVQKTDINYGHPTHQALAAMEIKELYTWWTEVYPNREDPYDASGWTQYCNDLREKYGTVFRSSKDTDERDESMRMLGLCDRIEKEYEDEDTLMMNRLIAVRGSLWT
jgi:hypothetical protein